MWTCAAALGIPVIAFDHGVLRAPPRGDATSPVLSVTAAAMRGPGSPADILCADRVLATRGWETPDLLARAAAGRRELVSRQVGGSWWQSGEFPSGDGIALVDAGGTGPPPSAAMLRTMLAAALTENASHRVVILTADRVAPRGVLADATSRGCSVITHPVDPWAAIARTERVYAAGGETGFLALLAGRVVRCFDDSFYSGWGVTADDAQVAQHLLRRTDDQIFAGACLVATRYLDPYRKTASTFEQIVSILAEWRKIESTNRQVAVLVGMSFWKRRRVAEFFRDADISPHHEACA
jgi:capsular polysaccharide export protein